MSIVFLVLALLVAFISYSLYRITGRRKGFLFINIISLAFLMLSCTAIFVDIDEGTQEDINIEEYVEEGVLKGGWTEKVNEIAESEQDESGKFDDVMEYVKEYEPTEEELDIIWNYIVEDYTQDTYLHDVTDHKSMLTKIFVSGVYNDYYYGNDDYWYEYGFVFDYHQNTKYTYRGIDEVEGGDVAINEESMDETLQLLEENPKASSERN